MSRITLACAITLCLTLSAQAKIKQIVIDTKVSPAFSGASFGSAGPYETLAGRAFGELDPKDPHNSIITDIQLAPRNANGRVEYMATFFLVKPIDMSKSSHLMWQEVPNRGGRITIGVAERNAGDIGISTGWQGDNMGGTVQNFPNTNDYAVVPVAKNPDGSPIMGTVIGRIFNARGMGSIQRSVITSCSLRKIRTCWALASQRFVMLLRFSRTKRLTSSVLRILLRTVSHGSLLEGDRSQETS